MADTTPCGCCPYCGALPGHQNPPSGAVWQHQHAPVREPMADTTPPFVLPTYGMPCCGHTIRQHADDPARWSLLPPACGCCRSGARLGVALALMADDPSSEGSSRG